MAEFVQSQVYPAVLPISVSHVEFPADYSTFENLGMPLACLFTPFIHTAQQNEKREISSLNVDNISKLARCDSCGSYINPFSEASHLRWFCSICGGRNSFTRQMTRYRQVDIRLLPESEHVLLDFPTSFGDNIPLVSSMTKVNASERPLVHIFLVQESMNIDTMQSVVEALTTAISGLHPDIHIVLLTFSHRIGIHRFSSDGKHFTVQYVHFTTTYKAQSTNSPTGDSSMDSAGGSAGSTTNPKDAYESTNGQSFEGRDHLSATHSLTVDLSLPLNYAVQFLDAAVRVGDAREAILSAVFTMFDSFTSPSSDGKGFGTVPVPQVLVGPTIDAVKDWLLKDPQDLQRQFSESSQHKHHQHHQQQQQQQQQQRGDFDDDAGDEGRPPRASLREFFGALSELSSAVFGTDSTIEQEDSEARFGRSDVTGFDGGSGSNRSTNQQQQQQLRGGRFVPADYCTGIIMHVFVSAPQDLPPRSHDSAATSPPPALSSVSPGSQRRLSNSRGAGWPMGVDPQWSKKTAKDFQVNGISVNIWSMSSFSDRSTDLLNLSHLALFTGGTINRCVLGVYPRDERNRFVESFNRYIQQQFATRCLAKLRTPRSIEVLSHDQHNFNPLFGESATLFGGQLYADEKLPNVLRSPVCYHDSAICFDLAVRNIDASQLPVSQGNSIVVQLAFAYDTLVESEDMPKESAAAESTSAFIPFSPERSSRSSRGRTDRAGTQIDQSDIPASYTYTAMDIFDLKDQMTNRDVSIHKLQPSPSPESSPTRPYIHRLYEDNTLDLDCDETQERIRAIQRLNSTKSAYNPQRKLLVVRRVRIISILIECTTKIPRLLQCIHPNTLVAYLTRRNLYADFLENFKESAESTTLSQQGGQVSIEDVIKRSNGVHLTVRWAVAILLSAVRAHANQYLSKSTSSSQQKKPKNVTTNANLQSSTQSIDELVVRDIARTSMITRILRLLFGLFDVLTISLNCELTGDRGDESAEMASILLNQGSGFVSRLLYPELLPIDQHFIIDPSFIDSPLALRRESMVLSNHAGYFLDAGNEFVLYRTIQGGKLKALKKPAESTSRTLLRPDGEDNNNSTKSGEIEIDQEVRFRLLDSAPLHNLPLPSHISQPTLNTQQQQQQQQQQRQQRQLSSSSAVEHDEEEDEGKQPTYGRQCSDLTAEIEVNERYLWSNWLGNEVDKRLTLNGTTVPRCVVAEAGTSTAGYITTRLIEDGSRCDSISFDNFVSFVVKQAYEALQ